MSEPYRWDFIVNKNGNSVLPVMKTDGLYIRYEDYARLKAEVERLTKAGDAMGEEMLKLNHPHASVYLWCKAKEGGQS